MQATSLGRKFCTNYMPSEVSLYPVLSQPSLGHQTSFSSSAGVLQHHHFLPQPFFPLEFLQVENLFHPSPFCRQIPSSFHSRANRRKSHTWALKSTACLLAGDSRPYCSFSHTHCRFPFLTYSPCCQNTTIMGSSTHIPEQLSQPVTLVPTRGVVWAGIPPTSLWP